MVVILGENEIKTIDDLGDLASDELVEMLPDADLSMEDANTIIMAARAHWFDDEEDAGDDSAPGEEGTEKEKVDEAN